MKPEIQTTVLLLIKSEIEKRKGANQITEIEDHDEEALLIISDHKGIAGSSYP